MKKWLIGGAIVLLTLVLGGIWFWSLGSLELSGRASRIVLSVDTPSVETRSGDTDAWHEVTGEVELKPSDHVRTGENGNARITFFGASVTRLQRNTTVIVEDATHTIDRSETANIRLRMVGGRVWSRVMSLFDLGSSFSVRTDSVVATVRGTAFDMGIAASGTTLWVSDSAVEVTTPQGGAKPFFVGEGSMATRSPKGAWTAVEPIRAEDRATEWFRKNIAADEAFEQDTRARLATELRGSGNPRVGSALERFVAASERFHLKFAGDKAPTLYGAYLGRRLMAIKEVIDQGKSGLAFQSLTPIEVEVADLMKSDKAEAYRPAIRRSLRIAMVVLGNAAPSTPHYRLLQRLEDLDDLVAGNDPATQLYARMVAIDARLATASRLIISQALEEAGMSLDAADQGIKNVTSDLEAIGPGLPTSDTDALDAKRESLVARAAGLHALLDTALAPPVPIIETPTSTTDGTGTPTSTTPGTTIPVPPVTTPTSTPTSNNIGPFDRITITAQPNPVEAGSNTALRVTGYKLDGSTVDATSHATFSLVGGLGSLNGPTYHATQAGSVTVNASVTDSGVTKTASTVIQVNEAVKLVRIDVIPQGPTSVRPGMKVGLMVMATYSSGLTANVTSKATWQSSNPSVGTAAGTQFTAAPNGNGTVTITGGYTEGGVTKTGTVDFQVE